MKILQVVRQFYPSCGGMQQYVLDLCSSLVKRDYQIDVLSLSYDFNTSEEYLDSEVLKVQDYSIKIYRVNAMGPRSFFLPAIKNLKLEQYQIIHVHGLDRFLDYFALESLMSKKQRKLIFTTHGGIFHSDKNLWLKKIWFKTLSKLSLSQIDEVIACSKQDYQVFENISSRVHLIENGVNLLPFKDQGNQVNYNQLLYVGGFLEHKRVDLLLRWFAKINDSNLSLHLVGDDSNKVAIQKLIQDLGLSNRVKLLGRISRDDLILEYQSAGVFVSASRYEGFGLSIVEAMAAGCALLLSDGGVFDRFLDQEDVGYLVDFETDTGSMQALLNKSFAEREKISQISQNK
ncbi:glycosyltransferase family 4 protein, partial [bacterium]|nr:glycosyltransferase family 4 protein [bacterium]